MVDQGDNEIEVPEHILGRVVEVAGLYTTGEKTRKRWLGDVPEDLREAVIENLTCPL